MNTEHEYTGTVPYTFDANGDALLDWYIKGNTTQSGTPTPSSPVDVVGVGTLDSTDYKIPITCNSTTSINLSSVQTTRQIKKIVFDGTENWTEYGSGSNHFFYISLTEKGYNSASLVLCTHFHYASSTDAYSISLANTGTNLRIYDRNTNWADATEFTTWLAAQYSAGTPVTVWYVLSSATTGIVNEPLQKIGDYADSITATQAGVTISTANGSNTLSVGTTVQPSSVYIKYQEGGDEMVTLAKIGGRYNTAILEIRGLSTDTKPTTEIEGMIVTNGSTYIEIDTGDTYMFDAENGVWHNITG